MSSIPEPVKEDTDKANLFGLLAKYYENRDLETFNHYYKKHLTHTHKVAAFFEQNREPSEELEMLEEAAELNRTLYPDYTGMPGAGAGYPGYTGMPGAGAGYPGYTGMPGAGAGYPGYTGMPGAGAGYPGYTGMPGAGAGYPGYTGMPGAGAGYPGYTGTPSAGEGSSGLPGPRPEGGVGAPVGRSYVRAIHAIPDAPAVDVYVDGFKLLSNVNYTTVSAYIRVPPGQYRIELRPVGQSGGAILRQTVRVAPGVYTTLAAAGTVSKPMLFSYHDDPRPVHNLAKVRFIHLSPNAPAVDIGFKGGPTLFSGVAFGKASNYMTLHPTSATLLVRAAASEQVVLELPSVRLEAHHTYTIVMIGLAGGRPPLSALQIPDA